jgi:hypothetical protein
MTDCVLNSSHSAAQAETYNNYVRDAGRHTGIQTDPQLLVQASGHLPEGGGLLVVGAGGGGARSLLGAPPPAVHLPPPRRPYDAGWRGGGAHEPVPVPVSVPLLPSATYRGGAGGDEGGRRPRPSYPPDHRARPTSPPRSPVAPEYGLRPRHTCTRRHTQRHGCMGIGMRTQRIAAWA